MRSREGNRTMPVNLKTRKQPKSSPHNTTPVSGIGRLTRWYLISLGLLAALTLTGQIVVQTALHPQTGDAARLIEVSRQPQLGQKLIIDALAVQSAETPEQRAARADELRLTAEEWEQSQQSLAQGQSARWSETRPFQSAMQVAAKDLLAAMPPDGSRQKPDLSPEITPLLQNEKLYLQAMTGVTAAYEVDTRAHIQSLQRLEGGLFAVMLLALTALAALVSQPGRVRQAIEAQRVMEASMADQNAALAEADRQVSEMQNVMANLSTVDALTGMKNHRAFQEQLGVELERALRHGRPLSLLLMDIDRFKSYNDTYGHPSGYTFLMVMSGLLKENARSTDIPVRFGGEEFAVILTETDMMGSVVLGERLRQSIAGADGLQRPVTASIGIATLTPGMQGVAELIAQADRALCAAKGEGRNRVSHAHRLPATEDNERPLYAHAA
jgi:diguanylate cyclase (GGDEF)-like protein